MEATMDAAGRLVVPAEVRRRLGLRAGTRFEVTIDGGSLRLERSVEGPELVRRGDRWVARPRVAANGLPQVDVPGLIDEERARRPG